MSKADAGQDPSADLERNECDPQILFLQATTKQDKPGDCLGFTPRVLGTAPKKSGNDYNHSRFSNSTLTRNYFLDFLFFTLGYPGQFQAGVAMLPLEIQTNHLT